MQKRIKNHKYIKDKNKLLVTLKKNRLNCLRLYFLVSDNNNQTCPINYIKI